MPRYLAPLVAMMLLAVAVFLIDVVVLPSYVLPAAPYAIPIVLSAYFLSPRLVLAVTVWSMVLQWADGWIEDEATVTVALYQLGLMIVGYLCVTISSRSRSELEQRVSAERYAAELDATIAAIADGVVIYDSVGSIVRTNSTADEMLGYSAAERRRPPSERLALLRPEAEDGTPLSWEDTAMGRALRGETVRGGSDSPSPGGKNALDLVERCAHSRSGGWGAGSGRHLH